MARLVRGLALVLLLTGACGPFSVEPAPSAPAQAAADAGVPPASPTPSPSAVAVAPSPALGVAAPGPTAAEPATTSTPESAALAPLPPLSADAAMDQVVERAPLPPEARFMARTLRPTMAAESDGSGHWIVSAGAMGQWRVDEQTWQVDPYDGTAELWELQSRLDLR